MNEIKPIETCYNGYRFRSRLEARWAVFFDTLGIEYEYEPQGYCLPSGKPYLPDFKVKCYGKRGCIGNITLCGDCKHCTEPEYGGDMADWLSNPFCAYEKETDYNHPPTFIKMRCECGGGQDCTEIVECSRYENRAFDLFIEVKGEMSRLDADKILEFAGAWHKENNSNYIEEYYEQRNSILIVGQIPNPDTYSADSSDLHSYDKMNNMPIYPWNYYTIDGDYFACYPAVHNGHFYLDGDDSNYQTMNIEVIRNAFLVARQARFEHGETPIINRRDNHGITNL